MQQEAIPLTDFERHFRRTDVVDVDVADALAVTEYRNGLALALDSLDEAVRATRDDEVDELVHLKQIFDVLA